MLHGWSLVKADSTTLRLILCVMEFVVINPIRLAPPARMISDPRAHQYMTKSAPSGTLPLYAERSASTYPSPRSSRTLPLPKNGGFPTMKSAFGHREGLTFLYSYTTRREELSGTDLPVTKFTTVDTPSHCVTALPFSSLAGTRSDQSISASRHSMLWKLLITGIRGCTSPRVRKCHCR
jgi:hypothetical protein